MPGPWGLTRVSLLAAMLQASLPARTDGLYYISSSLNARCKPLTTDERIVLSINAFSLSQDQHIAVRLRLLQLFYTFIPCMSRCAK